MIVTQTLGNGHSGRGLRVMVLSLALAAGALISAPAFAADAPKDADLVRDYVHYVRIARYDLAASNAQAMLDRLVPPFGKTEADKGGITLTAFVKIVDSAGDIQRFEESTARGIKVGEIESVSQKLLNAYDQGKREQARLAAEITKNVQLLVGTSRQRLVARERLIFAGEYAMPQLLENLQKNTDPALSAEIRKVMVDMGRQAIMPLASALPSVEGKMQETLCGILGDIRYKTALPFLYEVALNTAAPESVRRSAESAIGKIDSGFDAKLNPAMLYELLGESYYSGSESLISFPREPMQLVWNYIPGGGISATPVATEVFTYTMSMRMAEHALKNDSGSRNATALWVASNFKREFDTPKDYKHPMYSAGYRDGMYYAVASGPGVANRVLARALSNRDTMLARKAIAAIDKNAGSTVIASDDTGRPLLEALRYPSRRVQYEAALALAGAKPDAAFEGSDRVVPTLGSAIRDVSARYAVVVAGNGELGNSIAGYLRQAGFTVLPPAKSLSDLADGIASAPGIDLIVVSLPGGLMGETIDAARSNSRLLATPIVALTSEASEGDLRIKFGRDGTIALLREGSNPAQIAEATGQLLAKNSGGALSPEEAADYQTRALSALRDLAIASGGVFNVADATGPLVTAIETNKGKVREAIAEVLAHVNVKAAQVALADTALAAEGEEMLMLVSKLTASAKRFGNQLDERHIKRIMDVAGKGSDEQATAVAGLIGSLNLPNTSIVPMLGKSEAAK